MELLKEDPVMWEWLKGGLLGGDDRAAAMLSSPLVGPATREWLRRGKLQAYEPSWSDTFSTPEDAQAFLERMLMYERLAERDAMKPREVPGMPMKDPFQVLPVWTGKRPRVQM